MIAKVALLFPAKSRLYAHRDVISSEPEPTRTDSYLCAYQSFHFYHANRGGETSSAAGSTSPRKSSLWSMITEKCVGSSFGGNNFDRSAHRAKINRAGDISADCFLVSGTQCEIFHSFICILLRALGNIYRKNFRVSRAIRMGVAVTLSASERKTRRGDVNRRESESGRNSKHTRWRDGKKSGMFRNLKRLMGHNRLIGLAHSAKAGHHHLTQQMTTRAVPRAPDIFIVPIKFYFLSGLLSLFSFSFLVAIWITSRWDLVSLCALAFPWICLHTLLIFHSSIRNESDIYRLISLVRTLISAEILACNRSLYIP